MDNLTCFDRFFNIDDPLIIGSSEVYFEILPGKDELSVDKDIDVRHDLSAYLTLLAHPAHDVFVKKVSRIHPYILLRISLVHAS